MTSTSSTQQASALCDAVEHDNEAKILELRSAIDQVSSNGFTPLYTACMRGVKPSTFNCIMKQNPTVDLKGEDRETPLFIACHNNNVPFVQALLRAGANVNSENGRDNDTCLHLAAKFGYTDLTQLLLESGANINARNCRLETPLFAAAKNGKHETVHILLQNNANKNLSNEDQKNPLYIASEKGIKHCVILLKAEPKNLKEAKAEADVEFRMRPQSARLATSEEIMHRLQQQQEKEEKKEAPKATQKPSGAAAKENAGKDGKKPSHAHSTAPSKGKAEPPQPKVEPIQMTKIDVPEPPPRTHDPITGEPLAKCKSLVEVGSDPEPQLPRGLVLKPLVVEKIGGTKMIVGEGTDIGPIVPKSILGDQDSADDGLVFDGIILPKKKH